MSTIIIERSSELNNRLRDYGIYIDGKKVGTIANGETKDFEVAHGQHNICCRIDWCSSPLLSFETNDDKIRIFKVGGFKNGRWLMPGATILILLTYLLNYFGIKAFYFGVFVIPLFILLIYYLTIGRKRYLSLTECF